MVVEFVTRNIKHHYEHWLVIPDIHIPCMIKDSFPIRFEYISELNCCLSYLRFSKKVIGKEIVKPLFKREIISTIVKSNGYFSNVFTHKKHNGSFFLL